MKKIAIKKIRFHPRDPRLMGSNSLGLQAKISFGPANAVIVRSAIHGDRLNEVAVGRRRGRRPFQSCRIPWIIGCHFASVFDAPEEIHDERNLSEPHQPSGG